MAHVERAKLDVEAPIVSTQSVSVGAISGTDPDGMGEIGEATMKVSADNMTVNGVTAVGSMFVSGGASGVIQHATFRFKYGIFTSENVPAGFAALQIASINAFTSAGLLQSTATAKFENAQVHLPGLVVVLEQVGDQRLRVTRHGIRHKMQAAAV